MLNTTNMAFIQSLSQFISSGISIRRDPQPSPYILSTSPPDSTMELYVLEHKLQVCSIPKNEISYFCAAIIKIALLPDSRPSFFSITETNTGYTLIISEDDIKEFPKHEKLKTSGYPWRVFTVSVGAMGFTNELAGLSKIAKSIIGPLADHQVSVLCLSTYQSDYILVQEVQLDQTLRLLGSYFKIFNEDHKRINVTQLLSSSPSTPTDKIRPIRHPFNSPDYQYHITGLDASKLSGVVQILLELIFFSGNKETEKPTTFFHFSAICGDISLILDNDAIQKFPHNVLYTKKNEDNWKMIQIGNHTLDFEECGIVAQIVEPLAGWQFSTYYVSGYDTEYCLVLEKDIERILEILEKRKAENISDVESKEVTVEEVSTSAQESEEKECRPGEHMSLYDAIQTSPEEQRNYHVLSGSPFSPSDDSSYGTSPAYSELECKLGEQLQYNRDCSNRVELGQKNLPSSEPIPIP